MRSATLLTSLLLVALAAPGAAQSKVPLAWKGRKLDAAALPKDVGEAPAAAISAWLPWAKRAGYRMDLESAGKVLVLSPASGSRGARVLQLVGTASTWFDDLLPKPPPRTGEASSASTASSGGVEAIPEDPEGPPPGADEDRAAKAKPATTWGSGSGEPDSVTATLIALADEKDQKDLLAFLAAAHPEVAEWTASAAAELGFVLEIPLVGAYVENASGQEEWNADHEVLNRAVRLLTLRRFGQLPHWLVHGVAWEAETAFDGSIWVYPYRDEFVYTAEHSAWPVELATEFQGRKGSPLRIEELTGWKRRSWDGAAARHAFGLVHHLAAARKDRIALLCDDFRRYRHENDRVPAEDGTWKRDPSWEAPADAQAAILRARCGEKVLEEASAWLAEPTAPRPRSVDRRR